MSVGFPPSVCDGESGSSESLLMLADQTGSFYSEFGDLPSVTHENNRGGYVKRKNAGGGIKKLTVAEDQQKQQQQWFPENYNKGTGRSFGEEGSGSGTSIPWSRHGTNKGNGQNSNSNWISMISVKEKRKKKKH